MKDYYDGSGYPLQPVDSVTPVHNQPWPAAASASQPLGEIKSQDGDSLLFESKPPPSFDAEPTTFHQYLFSDEASRGSTRLRQSVLWWLTEILASSVSVVCLAGLWHCSAYSWFLPAPNPPGTARAWGLESHRY